MVKRKARKKPKAITFTKKTKDLPGMIKAISIIYYTFGILVFIAAVILLVGGTTFLQDLIPSEIAAELLSGALIVVALFLAVLGIFHIYLGKGIIARKKWAKVIQIILAIIPGIGTFGGLFSFPIGTIIGIFMLWVLLIKKETKNLFH